MARQTRPERPLPAAAPLDALAIGSVVDQRGVPVAGVELTATTGASGDESASRRREESATPLAVGRSNFDGVFVLRPAAELSSETRALLECGGLTLSIQWELEGRHGSLDSVSLPLAKPLALTVRSDVAEFPTEWRTIAHDVRRRPSTVGALAAALGSVAGDLSNARARAATRDLEAAFLDPTGQLQVISPLPSWSALREDDAAAYEASLGSKASGVRVGNALRDLHDRLWSYDDLTQVDWPLKWDQLADGTIGDAIGEGILGRDRDGLYMPIPSETPRTQDKSGYRDYLVEVWQRMAGLAWGTSMTAGDALDQLTARFHQNFTTGDETPTDWAELGIGIVTAILTDPAPAGLAVPVASVPARGTDSALDYLAKLVGLSGQKAEELGLRYRIRLDRPAGQLSSPIDENIATLQGLFRDSFQSELDPFHTPPDVRKQPFIPEWQAGKAPFFLEYDEWLAETAPFFGENQLSIERTLRLADLAKAAREVSGTQPYYAWAQSAAGVLDQIAKSLTELGSGEYRLALADLDAAKYTAHGLISARESAGYAVNPPLKARRARSVGNKEELLKFERYLGLYDMADNAGAFDTPGDNTPDSVTAAFVLFAGYFYWVLRSDALLGMGRFVESAKSLEVLAHVAIGAAAQDSPAGYFDVWNDDQAALYTAGPLPYTFDRADKVQKVHPFWEDRIFPDYRDWYPYQFPPDRIRDLLHRVDRRFIELRIGNVMLEWADALFRADEPGPISRARELFKGVLWLHGEDPEVSPSWPGKFQFWPSLPWAPVNAAVRSQVERAHAGFYKIQSGLNYFGATNDAVPVQRYRYLKDTADRFAALAKAAERDFLTALGNLEELGIDQLRTSNLLAKATAQTAIAGEQSKIAQANVKVAQQQVLDVQGQIAAKQAEMADRDSYFGQLSDFASGMVKTFGGLPGDTKSALGSAFLGEAGIEESSSAGLLGLGAGATILAGYGIFYYAGTTTLSAMAVAQNGRRAEVNRLMSVALPLAQEAVVSRQREVHIAELQASIADADISLARSLIAFQTARTLSGDFWASVAAVLRRVLRRYLDLGAWAGWLAERALAFEQARQVRIIRMDYFAPQLQGVTGGDLLQTDLAELEAARIAGERLLVPFVMAYSLAEEQPLAFGALKASGQCRFATSEEAARLQFPGTFGHRLRDVRVDVRIAPAGRRVRGILVNHGLSLAARDEGLEPQALLRFPDALPISESTSASSTDPRLAEVLAPFEGTGMLTDWTLVLDRDSSPGWFGDIADVVLLFEGRARFSEAVRTSAVLPGQIDRFALLAASKFDSAGLKKLSTTGTGTFSMDLRTFPFATTEQNRIVTNVMIVLPGAPPKSVIDGSLRLASPAVTIPFTLQEGVALSNGEPLRLPGSVQPDAPLNPAIGARVDQPWRLTIGPGAGSKDVTDVVLGIEYRADRV